ncbi:MAG: flagellar motor switch protein FliN [Alphaproteobacteria bacterium]
MADDQEDDLELNELEAEAPAQDPETASAESSAESSAGPSTEVDETHDERSERIAGELEAVYDIPVQVSAVLGKCTMQVSQLLKLGRGAVVELDRKVGEAIDIYVNNRLVARGEVVVVDERLGVTMTEIIKTDRAV